MTRTRVKICGIARLDDALAAARLGADAIGLVFAAQSPRALSVEAAAAIAVALPPFVARVGLFVDAEPALVRAVCDAVPLELLQFHGSEPAAYCRAFGRPYLKAIAMGDEGAAAAARARDYPDAAALLFDAHASGAQGGSGRTFDWSRIPRDLARPVVLAGGLAPGNVADAIAAVRPWAVDVSSGVEASPGIKDHGKMERFIDEVRRAG